MWRATGAWPRGRGFIRPLSRQIKSNFNVSTGSMSFATLRGNVGCKGYSSYLVSALVVTGLAVAKYCSNSHDFRTSCCPEEEQDSTPTSPTSSSSATSTSTSISTSTSTDSSEQSSAFSDIPVPPKTTTTTKDGVIDLAQADIDEMFFTENRQQDIFLDVYADWCPSCALLSPVIQQIGHSLKDTDIKVVMMEERQNKLHFLTDEECEMLPLLKLYKKDGSVIIYEGGGRSKDIVTWIHKHTDQSFDLETALERSNDYNPKTAAVLKDVVDKRLKNPAELEDEGFRSMMEGPCAELVYDSFIKMKLAQYIGGEELSQEFHQAIGQVAQCLKDIDHPSMKAQKEQEEEQQQERAENMAKKKAKKAAKRAKKRQEKIIKAVNAYPAQDQSSLVATFR